MHEVDISPVAAHPVDLLLAPIQQQIGVASLAAVAATRAYAPTVTAARSATVSAVCATSVDNVYVPNVGGTNAGFVTAVRAVGSGNAPAPAVTTDAVVTAVIATGTTTARVPGSPVNATVNAVLATETGVTRAPIVSGEAVLTGGGAGTSTALAAIPVVTGGSGATAFDAVGAGASSLNSAASLSWSHTASGSSRAVIVAVAVSSNSHGPASTWTRSVTYGGVAMTSLGVQDSAAASDGFIQLWGLLNPATGAQTVVASATKSGITPQALIGGSVSYTGVGSFGTAVLANVTAASSASVVVPSAVGKMVVAAFCCGSAISSPTQTQRYLNNLTTASRAGNLLIQDAAGAASVTLTASDVAGAESWGQIGVPLS